MTEVNIDAILDKLGIRNEDVLKKETSVSFIDKNKTAFLISVTSDKFVHVLLTRKPQTVYYQKAGIDDYGEWEHFGIQIESGIELSTLAQPEGHFDSGIFNQVPGYKKLQDHKPFPRENDEFGRYVLED